MYIFYMNNPLDKADNTKIEIPINNSQSNLLL